MATNLPPNVGEPAPWFSAVASKNPLDTVAFDELAGRYIVLFFFDTATRPEISGLINAFRRCNDLFDFKRAMFLGVSRDPQDFNQEFVCQGRSGQLILWDSTGAAAKQYGMTEFVAVGASPEIRPVAFVVSPALQIVEIIELAGPEESVRRVTSSLSRHLANPHAQSAPVLVVPNVFDRSFCDRLIDLYETAGGREIGVIEYEGKVVEQFDPDFRKRLDWYISDKGALQRTRYLLERRLLPMVYRAFQFQTTRIERYLVGCYDAVTGGHFRPHRDNVAPMGAHRRFAVTINLNEGYEGGYLRFPEFGDQAYRAAPGDAIVFSCSLLHEVVPVTRGRRHAFLSFFYDEQSQQIRDEYTKQLAASQKPVKAGLRTH